MLLTIERLANWNPQLFRELKGRLTFRNIVLTTGISILGQILLLMYHFNEQTGEVNDKNLLSALDWVLPFALVLGGVYMLIGDMAQEERRGTLNFIRLTPQSSQRILIGKMLGVPVLIYLATALAMPLNFGAASSAAIPLGFVLTFYVMLGAICGFFYSTTLFYTLLGGTQAWLGTIFAVVLVYPFLVVLNFFLDVAMSDSNLLDYSGLDQFQWFYLPLGSNLAIAYCFSLLSICFGTYWIWQFLNRRFRNPSATIVSKSQSYLLITCANIWLIGFGVTQISSDYSSVNLGLFLGFGSLFFLLPFCFLILIAALSPHRQTLQDWARYRGERKKNEGKSKKIFYVFPVALQDLMFGEKSPALVAIAINLAITAAIWIPWMMLPQHRYGWPLSIQKHQYILAFLLNANLALICAAIAQLILLMKTRKPQIWAAVAVSTAIVVPLATMAALGFTFDKNPDWFLISAFPVIGIQYASTTAIFLTILGQWSVLALLSLQLTRQLRKIGESNSKSLLAVRPSLPASN